MERKFDTQAIKVLLKALENGHIFTAGELKDISRETLDEIKSFEETLNGLHTILEKTENDKVDLMEYVTDLEEQLKDLR